MRKMKFQIGYRTLKTAVGAPAAIFIAQVLGLQNFVSAGILTILCIQVTKKKSLLASWERIVACSVGILLSIIFFELLGYHAIVIGVLLLVFIPIVVMLKASEGIVSAAVIILHFFSAEYVSFSFVLNEVAIILIGIGVALLANLYMPSLDHKIESHKDKIEKNFRKIFLEIVNYLRVGDSDWDGKEIPETITLIEEAKGFSLRIRENKLLSQEENLYYAYFQMREKQFEIIERVFPMIISISHIVEQGRIIADFIEELAEHVHSGNTADDYLQKLDKMKVIISNMELPKTREEFETRAALLHFLNEMRQYLLIKRSFKGIDHQKVNEKSGKVES